MARSAFISRREGRYVFSIRTPACLKSVYRSGSIRLALGTSNYRMASTRAARIASWMLRIKGMDGDPRHALLELWPRLQELAREPVRSEDDYVERSAFQAVAFKAQFLVRHAGLKPDAVAPGWDEHFVMLIRENGRAGNQLKKSNSLEGRIERRREQLFSEGADLVVLPAGVPAPASPSFTPATVAAAVTAALPADGNRTLMSTALKQFLDWREGEDGDRRAANDVGPIIQFAIDLWKDPCIGDIGPEQIVALKQAMPEVPTPAGFLVNERSLFQRWTIAKANNYLIETEGKRVKLVRVSSSTLRKRYRTGLNSFWNFLRDNLYVTGPAPDFTSRSKQNPPAVERDAFEEEELLKFLQTPLFTGCDSISRVWVEGQSFCQNYFYWAVLIQLLCGLRPSEISQLRCADIATLYGQWHFRFAKRSLTHGEDENSSDDDVDVGPGGNDAKTKNAFRWVPIHPLLEQLGIIARREAIVATFILRKTAEAGGIDRLSNARRIAIEEDAQQQWLFPEWRIYVLPSGQIRWSHAVSKAWQYVKVKFKMQRKGLALYSARHTFKGFIDDLANLSERSRLIVMGHSTKINTAGGYGPKSITEEQAEVILTLSNKTITRMSDVLLGAYQKAQRGELKAIEPWRNDERTSDKVFQAALAKRAEEYR